MSRYLVLVFTIQFALAKLSISHFHVKRSADFIIVGGGTAGCVLATRLCVRNPSRSVLLLERSTPRNKTSDLQVRSPRLVYETLNNPSVTETFFSTPQQGAANRSFPLWAGNTLGGSSAINGMQWLLPLAGTVERWGISGLSTPVSKLFFRRAFRAIGFAKPPKSFRHVHLNALLNAARKSGLAPDRGPFDDSPTPNLFHNRLAISQRGRRTDSCTAYLRVAARRCNQNLRIIQGANVNRVIISQRRALGVTVKSLASRKGSSADAIFIARQEVILSAGPFHSPRLLLHSGIGPQASLRKYRVHVHKDLPVGSRAQARLFVAVTAVYKGLIDEGNNVTLVHSHSAKRQFLVGRGGVLGRSVLHANGRDERRGYLSALSVGAPPGDDAPIMTILCVGNAAGFGSVRIQKEGRDAATPIVDMGILNDRREVQRMRQCAKIAHGLLGNLNGTVPVTDITPARRSITDDWVRENAQYVGHFVGGCAVGSVLTNRLRVKGVRGLRVVDASAIPEMPVSAGPLASVYMLAEYASNLITQDYETWSQWMWRWIKLTTH